MSQLNFDEDNFFSHFGEIITDAINETLDNSPYFIGMMTGTSLDGMDAVLCQFYDTGEIEILESISTPLPSDLRLALLALTTPNGANDFIVQHKMVFESELDLFGWASVLYSEFASIMVIKLLQKSGMNASDINAIGCHGQTVRHRPHWCFSLQLIDPNVLAERTAISVVSDFRRRDMAVSGQGAPLVPAFHQAFFGQHDISAVLNLGGIANLTILDNRLKTGNAVLGFDVGVANLLIDGWCQRHRQCPYDDKGDWAKSGQVLEHLLTNLLAHPFFKEAPPKSTGREAFNLTWLDNQLQLNQNTAYAPQDVQATLVELTAKSIADSLDTFDFHQKTLLVCGGGAFNDYLLARLAFYLSDWQILTSDHFGINPSLIEPMAFAWLARQSILGQAGNLPSVTGAKKAVVLGQVCFA